MVNILNICSDDELCGDDDSLDDLTDAYRDQAEFIFFCFHFFKLFEIIDNDWIILWLWTDFQLASDREQALEDKKQKQLALRKKILAVAKMANYFQNLREEQEAILHMKVFTFKISYIKFKRFFLGISSDRKFSVGRPGAARLTNFDFDGESGTVRF